MKVEDEDEDEELLQEELLDVASAEQFEVQMSGGACAQVNESRNIQVIEARTENF